MLNGAKTWISGIGLAEWYLTFATLDRAKGPRGVCAFVVERGFPGFTERPIRNKLAFRPAQVGELVFEDCRVPAENLIGREGEGSGSPSAPWRTGASPWPAARWGSPRRVSTPR